jgi:iron complex transport system substrate-binding protein
LQQQLVGISHSCDYPNVVTGLPVLTSTSVPYNAGSADIDQWVRRYLGDQASLYQLDLQALELAQPDLLVSQRLCDVCAVSASEVELALSGISSQPKLVDLNPGCLSDVFDDILKVALAADVLSTGQQVVADLKHRISRVEDISARIPTAQLPRVAMIEWLDPPFSSGHWNPELVELAGAIDCLGPKGQASRTIDWQQVLDAKPDVLILSCCGFDVQRTRDELAGLKNQPQWLELLERLGNNIWLTDGNAIFSRPGPRLIDGLESMAHALHPNHHRKAGSAQFLRYLPLANG